MAFETCAFCDVFGKGKAELNVIIITGALCDDFIYAIKGQMETDERKHNLRAEYKYTNYSTAAAIVQTVSQSKANSELTAHTTNNLLPSCCRGSKIVEVNSQMLQSEKNKIEQWLHTKSSSDDNRECKILASGDFLPSWFLFIAPVISNSEFWENFINMIRNNPKCSNYMVICLLVDEDRLFTNAMDDKRTLVDYNENILTAYEKFIKSFFQHLDASEDLQKNSILVPDNQYPTDRKLKVFFKSQYEKDLYRDLEEKRKIRTAFLKSFKPQKKCANDVNYKVSKVVDEYEKHWGTIIAKMCSELESSREIQSKAIELIIHECHSCTRQERGVLHRLLVRKFKIQNSNDSYSLITKLAIVAIELINNKNPESIPLIYGIAEAIYKAGSQPLCRRHIADDEYMYKLNLLLINQSNCILTLAGLKLCGIILSSDVIQDMYAIRYSKYDSLAGEKIINAIIRLISPYIEFERAAIECTQNDFTK